MESPLGRVFQRKFVMAFATVIVACFAYIFAAAPVAHAADASWKDDSNITYNGQSYGSGSTGPNSILINNTPASWAKFPGIPHDAPLFINQTIVNGKLEVIYFDPSGDFDASKPNDYLYSSSAHFITYDYNAATKTPSNPSNPSSIGIAARATRAPPSGNTSCSIDGIGWIVCPVTNFLAQAMDYIFGIVQSFLAVQPLSSSTDKPMYIVWDQMRNIANVAFAIGFLILVYGQITGGLVSNYTLKKMVPRIVIAAVLVNISYLICQLAVDLANILGYSINNIFLNMRDHAVSLSGGNGWGETSWKEVATVLLAGGGAVAIGGIAITSAVVGGGAIFLFIPLLLSVLFVVLMTFLILAARQAIITILIIIAPIAFVAYLLPNTEKWFHKWRDTFFTLLLVFPGFSFIFGGSQLAGTLIIQNANGPNQLVIMILGMAVQVMPLAITPLLLKLGGGVLNRFAGIVNNPTKGLFDKGKNLANEYRDQAIDRGNRRLSAMNANGTLPRYGIRRMAYRRFASKLEREGEKSANEAMSKAYFTQTAGGQRVSDMTKRAGLEQEYADNRNQARWNNQVRTNSVLRQRTLDSHEAHSRADMYKKNVDAQAEEHWSHTQQHNAALRAVRTDTHLTEGRAKLAEDAMTNADERQLQTQINGNLALRNLKIGSDVDAAHAKLQSDNVAAEGKAAFQRQLGADAVLKAMNNQTVQFEKEAAARENTLKQRAEARWERITTNVKDPEYNQALRQVRIYEAESSDDLKHRQTQWTGFIEELHAKGAQTPTISTAAEMSVAGNLKQLARDIKVEEDRATEFKLQQQQNIAEALKTDETLRKHAGGNTPQGAARVYARAKKEGVKAWLENVDNQRSVINDYSLQELLDLYFQSQRRDGTKATEEERIAAQQEIMLVKGNNWAVQQVEDFVTNQKGMFYNEDTNKYYYDALKTREITDQDEIETRRTEQQMFIDAYKKGKNKLAHVSGTDMGHAEAGLLTRSSYSAILRDVTDQKYSPRTFLDMDPDELSRMIEMFRHEDVRDAVPDNVKANILKAITDLQADEQRRGDIKGRERGLMNSLASYLDPADARTDVEKETGYWANPDTLERMHQGDVTADGKDAVYFQAPVRAPSVFRVGDLNVYADGAGPNGKLKSRP